MIDSIKQISPSNEAIFVLHLLLAGVMLLAAARMGRVWVTALIVVCTILMNIEVMKQMRLFSLEVTGGVISTWGEWVDAVLFAYVIKVGVAAADTGFLYLTTWGWLVPRGSRRGMLAK